MWQIITQRFFRRGDRRLGFYTLLLSTGQTWNPKQKQAFQGGDPLLWIRWPTIPTIRWQSTWPRSSPRRSPADPRISAICMETASP